jgi:hypothetical protein
MHVRRHLAGSTKLRSARALLAKQKPGAYLRVLKMDALTGASEIIIIFQITAPSKHFITSGGGAL